MMLSRDEIIEKLAANRERIRGFGVGSLAAFRSAVLAEAVHSPDYGVLLEDIAEAAETVREFTGGITREELAGDRKTRDAVIRNLEVIGEAAKKLPEDLRARYPDVEWRPIAGLRDRDCSQPYRRCDG